MRLNSIFFRPSQMVAIILACGYAVAAFAAQGETTSATASPFVRPPELERDILFWQRVYTEAGTDGGFIHDDAYLDVVYERLTFSADISSAARAKRVDAAKDKYAAILRKLAGGTDGLTAEEQRVRDLWPKSASRNTLVAAAGRVRFQLGQANRFKEGLVRSGQWRPQIQKIFERQGLPTELAALPHVESSFNPYAYSKVGAAGMWQFMRSTGRRFLRIDSSVDERLDPYKSSEAAASFLKQNYSILGKWPLALTAYNHGPAGMRRAVDRLGTDDIAVIVREYESRTFGFASRNFYLAFLAALEIDNNPEKFFGGIRRDAQDNSQAFVLPDYMPMPTLVAALRADTEQLKRLNPSLLPAVWSGSRRVPRGFELRAPPTIDLSQALARVPSSERHASQVVDTQHRVQRGETLSTIATRYGVSQARLAELNTLRQPYRLRVGQALLLPQTSSTPIAIVAEQPRVPGVVAVTQEPRLAAGESSRRYIVRRGDSVSRIATKHGLSEQALMQLNNIKQSDFIYEGQVLALDAQTAGAEPAQPVITPTPAVVAAASQSAPVTEAAEPTSQREAEDFGPTLVPGAQTADSADPSDYAVGDDNAIRVEATETLGHYAEWLGVSAARLRELNNMSRQRPLIVGRRVRLDFSRLDHATFEARRSAYHRQLQDDFFAQFRIAGSDVHKVKAGDSIWVIAQKRYNVPIWLLRQYNPDVDLEALRPGTAITIPRIEPVTVDATRTETAASGGAR
ncbi:MAG: LysM peptidoglycan-binding domain-containing protein [Candidatus Obscuribacterales bacterium]|nr:LysM peptidoglycan-binding domain-containing protein [Steroidobacteraceae bacterium]